MNQIFIQAKAPLEFSILSTQDWHFNNSLKKYILELQMNSFFAVATWNERRGDVSGPCKAAGRGTNVGATFRAV